MDRVVATTLVASTGLAGLVWVSRRRRLQTTRATPRALFFGHASELVDKVRGRLSTKWQLVQASHEPGELARQVSEATALVGGLKLANTLLQQSGPSLRLLQCHFTGTDWLDTAAVPPTVTVCNATGQEKAIAEWVLAAMLYKTVRIHAIDGAMRSQCARATAEAGTPLNLGFAPPFLGSPAVPFRPDLAGKTVGIVGGMGKIGTEVATRAAAFGCEVVAIGRRAPASKPAHFAWLRGQDGLDELLRVSDYVVLACPLTDATRGLIGAPQLATMKSSATLINVARGGVVDEDALFVALQNGQIGGAAIDVWWRMPDMGKGDVECAPCDLARHPFHSLPNVLLSNHTSGWSSQQWETRMDIIADNLDRLAEGRPLGCVVVPAK